MDGLWDPPNYQATEDTNSLCLAYDVIEETALNEKICIQVLSILIGKADLDIIELEKELMDLVTQLACTDEEFSDMFCTSLRVKTDFLDLSIRKLKDDAQDFSSSSMEPAESINDMLKSLFCCYLRKKDQQKFADNTTVASSSYHQVHSDKLSGKNKQMGGSSNSNHMGKSTSVIVTPLEKHTILQAKVKVEEENADYHCMTPMSKYSSECLFRDSMESMNIEGNKFQMKSPIITKDVPKNKTIRCKSICQKPSLKTKGKWDHQLKMVKSQPDDESIGYTSMCLVESSQEANVKRRITKKLGFFLGNSNPDDKQEPKTSLSQSLCLVDSSQKPKAKQNITKELGFSRGNSDPEDHQESKASLSGSLCLVDSSQKPKAKQNITKELGFCCGNEDRQEPKVSLSQSLCLVDSSQIPKVTQNGTKELGFFLGNSNPENHQEPKASLSQSLYSTKTYKRRQRLSSPRQTSSSSLLLLEEPKPLPILDVAVTNLHDMDYYTVDDLKRIAKQRNMKGCYKLRKAELAQLLGIKVTEGNRKQKRKETLPSSKDKGCAIDIAA